MSVADDLVEAMTPWTASSPDLSDLARAIGGMWAAAEFYYADRDDGTPGWAVILDPDQCPTEGLPYLAQWVGERLRGGLTDAQMREWINDKPNSRRGTPEAIALAAQRSLVGGRLVQIFERKFADGTDDPNGDNFIVYTYASDTPDSNQVWQDLLEVIPADMVCHYSVLASPTWAELAAGMPTWADVEAAYPTWTEVEGGIAGGSSWSH